MQSEKIKGVVIKLIDYKDADKLAEIFSFEDGIVTAKFAGVRKDKAKFKAVAQMFNLAEFVINKTGQNNIVTQADIIDMFKGIVTDYDRTMCAYVVADMIHILILRGKPEQELFLHTVQALKQIETQDPYVSLIGYIIKFIQTLGMGLSSLEPKMSYLDGFTGEFLFSANQNAVRLDSSVYDAIYQISNGSCEKVPDPLRKKCLNLLRRIIALKFDSDVQAFNFVC